MPTLQGCSSCPALRLRSLTNGQVSDRLPERLGLRTLSFMFAFH